MTKRKTINAAACLAVFACLCLLLIFPQYASLSARNGIETCLTVIVPSLFPFFVISNMIIELGLATRLGKLFSPFMRKLFRVPKEGAVVLVLGMLSGFPVGASTAVNLYENGLCSKNEAERMLTFSNNPSPAFVISAVGFGMIGSVSVGWLLFLCQTAAAIITGVLISHIYKIPPEEEIYVSRGEKKKKPPFFLCFTESVKSGFASVLNVCAFIIFFLMLTGLLDKIGLWNALGSHINLYGFNAIVSGFFEITSGVGSLGKAIPIKAAVPLAAVILGWSGLSVHSQVLSFTLKSGLSAKPYLLSKVMQAFLGGLFALVLANILL